jgi:hypothetical protein
MKTYHLLEVDIGILVWAIISLYRNEMSQLCEMINYYPNRVKTPFNSWQPNNEIQNNLFLLPARNREWLQ